MWRPRQAVRRAGGARWTWMAGADRLSYGPQQRAPIAEVTFHRAIDGCRDPLEALATAGSWGAQRCSPGATPSPWMALACFPAWSARRGGAGLAAAGGIGPGNVVDLVEATGVKEVHFAAQRPLKGMRPRCP